MSKNTNYLVVLSETKDIKDDILNLCYPWVSPMGVGLPEVPEIPEILEIWQKQKNFGFCVICMGVLSTKYSPFTPG